MTVTLLDVSVGDIVEGYVDDNDRGCYAYSGRCCIRPPFSSVEKYASSQQSDDVIRSLLAGLPLGMMHWLSNGDNKYQVMDGRRRLRAICEYVHGDLEVDGKLFDSLTAKKCQAFLDTKLLVYVCDGTPEECIDWFNRVSVNEGRLSKQCLFDAVYGGSWLDDAKRRFADIDISGLSCIFADTASDKMLNAVISWCAEAEDVSYDEYIQEHRSDADASWLVTYLNNVVPWVHATFGSEYPEVMAGQPWGEYYNDYGRELYNSAEMLSSVRMLMEDDSVTNKRGIFEYLLWGDLNSLKLKKFTEKDKKDKLAEQDGKCKHCHCEIDAKSAKISCVTPWPNGKMSLDNAEVLCKKCDGKKKRNVFSVFG